MAMELKPLKLMIPGPIQPDDEVLEAMGSPVQPHYGPMFTKYFKETLDLLHGVVNTNGNVFIMPGTGSTAIDACLGSAFSTGEKILVGNNGFFGDRLEAIARGYGLEVVRVAAEWGQQLRAEDFAEAFRRQPDAVGAAVVHLETSTTVVNPIEEIGPLVREMGKVFFVDSVSSLGGLPFQMDEWCIDLTASASQKCLGAPPGLAVAGVGRRGWEAIERNPCKGHGWYGDLTVWRWYLENWGDWHPFPITMASSNLIALRVALRQLLEEGISNRLTRYRALALRLRNGLREIGLQPFTPDEMLAPVLTAAVCPEGVTSEEIVEYMADVHGTKISTGLGVLKEKLIRIGHMSPTVSEKDIDEVLYALAEFQEVRVAR